MPKRKPPRKTPEGRKLPGPKSDKEWRDALRIAVHHEVTKGQGVNNLTMIARRVVIAAKKGDMRAVQEIGDRLDGKATQQLNVRRIGSFEDLSDDELLALARGK